ncbi:octanoyltransferase [Phycisphaera mikurensis NBRC 102666]|uniref:Octanoyltransferase n=2 Tax=Phycisphaera TaxID=666508 RepID=I0IHS4_PHYMF|nr:octanoyltransferase [Phycisphaera mikurensis NBRC 102666]
MLRTEDLGVCPYEEALRIQRAAHAEVAAGGPERLLLVEHPAVITLSRRRGVRRNLLVSEDCLATRRIDLQETDRGGDVTAHGPGQQVVYPILRLADHRLNLSRYMRLLEEAAIATAAAFGVAAHREAGATGVWVARPGSRGGEVQPTAKLCALGVRIAKNTTLHGLAFNVRTDLGIFALIDPCGLGGRPVTSLLDLLGDACPGMDEVREALVGALVDALAAADRGGSGPLPPAVRGDRLPA